MQYIQLKVDREQIGSCDDFTYYWKIRRKKKIARAGNCFPPSAFALSFWSFLSHMPHITFFSITCGTRLLSRSPSLLICLD